MFSIKKLNSKKFSIKEVNFKYQRGTKRSESLKPIENTQKQKTVACATVLAALSKTTIMNMLHIFRINAGNQKTASQISKRIDSCFISIQNVFQDR